MPSLKRKRAYGAERSLICKNQMSSMLVKQRHFGLSWMAWEKLSCFFWMTCGLFLLFFIGVEVANAETDFTLFVPIQTLAKTQSMGEGGWIKKITDLAHKTFWLLAGIEMCWAAAIWALEKDNLNSLAVEVIQKIMFIGFFYTLLLRAPEWIPTIGDTFKEVGEQATGNTRNITPDTIMSTGLDVVDTVWKNRPTGFFEVIEKIGQIVVAGVVTIVVIISTTVVALQLLALNIESYIMLAAGAFLLALGSTRWTSEYVSKYLHYSISLGIRLLVLLLILGLTTEQLKRQPPVFEYKELFQLLAVALMQALLAIRAPEMAGSLLSGGVGFSAGGMKSSVASIASSATSAASMGASAISAARAAPSAARNAASSVASAAGSMASGAANAARGAASAAGSAAKLAGEGLAFAAAAGASTAAGLGTAAKIAGHKDMSASKKLGALATVVTAPAKEAMGAATKAGQAIGGAATKVGQAISGAATSAGQAINTAVSDAGKNIENKQKLMPKNLQNALKKASS